MLRRRLAGTVERAGIGLHSGVPVVVTLGPAPFGRGIVFRTPNGDVPATLDFASAAPGATLLSCGSARVSTPEHLLAALSALGVTDALVDLDADELPALDGSAAEWVAAIDEAGREDGPEIELGEVPSVSVEGHGGRASIGPGASIRVEVAFEDGPVGALEVPLTEEAFRAEVAWARTFVLARDVEALRAAGRGRGATAENTVVWPGSALRAPDEPVRHKLLDAWGDFALLGPVSARLEVVRGSHRLHLELLTAVAERSS